MKNMIKKWQYVLLACILLLGFWLRSDNLYTWPRLEATFDEYAWTWQGMILIKFHIPTSWSPHPQYAHFKDITYQHTHFLIFFLFTGLSMLQVAWAQALGFSFFVFRFFLGLYGLTLLPLFFPKATKISFIASYASLVSVFLLTLWSVFSYNEQ